MSPDTTRPHVSRLSLLVLALCLAGFLVVGSAVATSSASAASTTASQTNATTDQSAATTEPQVTLALNGQTVRNGSESEVVKNDPTLTINASVGSATTAGTTVENVVVRINGQTLRSYEPDERRPNISVDLPLNRGNNTVTVIVEDSADNVNSRQVAVAKDDLAPWIGLTGPYQSRLTSLIQDGTVSDSVVGFGVRAGDFSGIEYGTITINYTDTYTTNYTNQETDFSNVETIRVTEPGKRFSRDGLVGYGNNTVTISLTDVVGNTRTQQFTLELLDTDAPTVTIDLYPEQTTDHRIDLSGQIQDNVWIRNASLQVVNLDRKEEVENVSEGYKSWNYTKVLKDATPYDHARSGRSLNFTEGINLEEGNSEITVKATDHLGQTITRTITIERLESVDQARTEPPEVTIDRNRTHLQSDGNVRLVASITDADWDIDNVAIETSNLSSNKILDFEQFRSLGNRNSVSINTTLRTDSGNGSIVVRASARDRNGQEDVAVQQITRRTDTPDEPDTDPSTTPNQTTRTPTATQTTEQTPTTTVPTTATTTPTTTSTNESANASDADDSGGLLGGLPGAIIGFVVAIIPFVVGGIVFVTIAYFVLRRVREGGSESAS